MFTGIIEEKGIIHQVDKLIDGARILIEAKTIFKEAVIGASFAVNGVCLSLVELKDNLASFDVVEETLRLTNLKTLIFKASVNLERPLAFNGRIDGHLVQGHIDGVGTIKGIEKLSDGSKEIKILIPENLLRYMVHKGSVAIDGISLTIMSVNPSSISIAIIPLTNKRTSLGESGVGDTVNIEVDLIAKYVERLEHFRNQVRV